MGEVARVKCTECHEGNIAGYTTGAQCTECGAKFAGNTHSGFQRLDDGGQPFGEVMTAEELRLD